MRRFWINVLIAIVLIVAVVATAAHAGISECIDATCRVTCPDGSGKANCGSGCVIQVSNGYAWILTNDHVASGSRAWCQFYRHGHTSQKMEGVVKFRHKQLDAAIIAVHASHFGGWVPPAIPTAPADYVVRPGETVLSVGCAEGHWPSLWRGHAIGYSGSNLLFRPGPEGGRSGSAIFSRDGRYIVGLLKQRNTREVTDQTHGIATYCRALRQGINASIRTADAGYFYRRDQCGPNGCPPQQQQQQQPQGGNNWPTLPPAQVEVAPKVDLTVTNGKLDALNDNVAALLVEIRTDRAAPEPIPVPDVTPVVEEQAAKIAELRQADELATAEREKLAEAVQGAVDVTAETHKQVGQVVAEQQRVSALITKEGTIGMRRAERLDRIEKQLGEDAGKIETTKAYMKDWFDDRIRNDGTAGWIRAALILALAAAFTLFVVRDIKDKRETGDPLAIEKLVDRIQERLGRDQAEEPTKQ